MSKVFKYSDSTKAYYYQSKISQKSVRKIRVASIFKWIVGMPIQIWRIPWSFILFFRELGLLMSGLFGGENGMPEIGVALTSIVIILAAVSMFKTFYLFAAVISIMFIVYCIFRCIYDTRECYRITFNRNHGYADDYDEWATKFDDPVDDDEGYFYYYRATGSSDRYDKTYDNKKRTYKTRYGDAYNGSPYSQYEAKSSENMFFGMDKSEAKKKYRELMKMYHPDNKETGNPAKAREINEMYDEYEELYK